MVPSSSAGVQELMATYSLTCRPLTSVGGSASAREISYGGMHKDVHASAMVSSASHLKFEAARLCQEAAQTKNVADGSLVSSFWSIGSRRGLLTSNMSCSESVRRPGGHLVVVRLSLAHAAVLRILSLLKRSPSVWFSWDACMILQRVSTRIIIQNILQEE